jgi:hypothetical protein
MLAVMLYFWSAWRQHYFSSWARFALFTKEVVLATAFTGMVGLILLLLIERVILRGSAHAEVEQLFGNVYIIAAGLVAVGVLIIRSGRASTATPGGRSSDCATLRRSELSRAYAYRFAAFPGPGQQFQPVCFSDSTWSGLRSSALR